MLITRRRHRPPRRLGLRYLAVAMPICAVLLVASVLLLRTQTADDLLDEAREAQAKGLHARAVQLLDRAVKLAPDDAELYFERGRSNQELRRFEPALLDFEEYRRLKPDSEVAVQQMGWIHLALGQYEFALARFLEAERRFPEHAERHQFSQGHVLYAWSNELKRELEIDIKRYHDNTKTNADAALAALEKYLVDLDGMQTSAPLLAQLPPGLDQKIIGALEQRAMLAKTRFGEAHRAMEGFYLSASLPPETGALLAEMDYRAGRFYRAKLTCDMMIRKGVEDKDRITYLEISANVNSELERFDLSARDFQKVNELHTKSGSSTLAFEAKRLELQDRLRARETDYVIKSLEVHVNNVPQDIDSAYLYARARQLAGDLKGAVESALKAYRFVQRGSLAVYVKSRDRQVEVLDGLYDILEVGSQWQPAYDLLNMIITLSPDNQAVLRKRARFAVTRFQNDYGAALDLFRLLQLSARDQQLFDDWLHARERLILKSGRTLESYVAENLDRWVRMKNLPSPDSLPVGDTRSNKLRQEHAERWQLVYELENDVFLLYELAQHYLRQGNVDEAGLLLKKIINRYPEIAQFRYELAQVAYAQHDYLLALSGFRAILADNPTDFPVVRYAARCHRHLGDEAAATSLENDLIESDPGVAGREIVALRALEKGDFERVDQILQIAEKDKRKDADIAAIRARLLIDTAARSPSKAIFIQQAQRLLKLVLDREPANAIALPGAVKLYAGLKDREALRASLAFIKDAGPGVIEDDLIALAELLDATGYTDIAQQFLFEARKRLPYHLGLALPLARMQVRLHHIKEAAVLFAEADARGIADTSLERALILVASQEHEKAVQLLVDAKAHREGEAACPSMLAAANAMIGSSHEAQRFLERAEQLAIRGEPHDSLLMLARACIAISPPSAIDEKEARAASRSRPRRRDRDLDELVDVGLRDKTRAADLIKYLAMSRLFALAPGFADLALGAAQKAVQVYPASGLAARRLASLLEQRDQKIAAVVALYDQLQQNPLDNGSVAELVRIALELKPGAPELVKIASQLSAKRSDHVDVVLLTGVVQESLGRTADARKAYQDLLIKDKGNLRAGLRLAALEERDGQIATAESVLYTLLLKRPLDADVRAAFADFRTRRAGQTRIGSEVVLMHLAKFPQDFALYPVLLNEMPAGQRGPQLDKFVPWLTAATKQTSDPLAVRALAAVAGNLMQLGKLVPASKLLARARAIDLADKTTLILLGTTSDRLDDVRTAVHNYDLAESLYGTPPLARARLARLLLDKTHDRARARELAEKAQHAANAPLADATEVLAETAYLHGHLDEATTQLTRLAANQSLDKSERLMLMYRTGLTAMLAEQPMHAAQYFGAVIDAKEEHPAKAQASVWRLLIGDEQKKGRKASAKAASKSPGAAVPGGQSPRRDAIPAAPIDVEIGPPAPDEYEDEIGPPIDPSDAISPTGPPDQETDEGPPVERDDAHQHGRDIEQVRDRGARRGSATHRARRRSLAAGGAAITARTPAPS
ncbi:MAG: tetratricopeptide repeat protein [Planctomycetota bacterium]